MKRIRYILIILLFSLFVENLNAQQAPFYTQYMLNDYLINPAVAGTYNYFQVRANSRIQWIGINDSPRTMSIAGYGPFKQQDMGYGGYIYNDVTGPESRLFFGGTYAYNIAINDEMRISGGLTVGIMQYKLDGTVIKHDVEFTDPAFPQTVESRIIPDASLGFYLYASTFYVGISAHQLFGNKYNISEIESSKGVSKLTQHLYLSGGYNLILNSDFVLLPSALIKYTQPFQFQFDINVKATYQRRFWLGLSYRYQDAVAVIGGYNYANKFYFGISYDVTTSQIRKYSNGTIEVMLGYRFNKIK
ncbi:MAG: type IX secretion system membrane protein PorP/SprF [Bacteroidales bacterium]|nr:type IX secretion system membrane protein PorP/SprF [Bacteroidales bacterium]